MTEREERAAKNEDLFRRLNERLHALAEHAREGSTVTAAPALERFVCECASTDCSRVVELTADEYSDVRALGTRFLVFPANEHIRLDLEDVVARTDRYWIVQKRGDAGAAAEVLDAWPGDPL